MFDRWNQSVPAMVAFAQQREKEMLHSFDDTGEAAGPVRTDCGFALKNRRCSGFFRCTFLRLCKSAGREQRQFFRGERRCQ